mmetsp:Transcript_49148/g.117081  ORF Transcript_49148/g.117081 Transcript_49148/m.117081 type:complete len:748 (-) Transcript_49148:19-2262(-)
MAPFGEPPLTVTTSPHERIGEAVAWLAAFDDAEAMQIFKAFLPERPMLLQTLVDWAVPDYIRVSSRVLEEGRFEGTVKSYNLSTGFGIVSSLQAQKVFGKDLIVSSSQTRGRGHPDRAFTVGAPVSFAVLMHSGSPQAFDLALQNTDAAASSAAPATLAKGSPAVLVTAAAAAPSALATGLPAAAPAGPPVDKISRFIGTVENFNIEKKYGFLHCDDLMPLTGKPNVFVHQNHLSGVAEADLKEGNAFSFTLAHDDKGKPMAVELVLEAVTPNGGGVPGSDARYCGTLKRFYPEKHYGFLYCEDLVSNLGKADIFVHQSQLSRAGSFNVGQVFFFGLSVDEKGKPMAVNVEPEERQYVGKVRNFEHDKRYGFLLCPDLQEILGKPEIFFHASNLLDPNSQQGLAAGTTCNFKLALDSKKKLMASQVYPVYDEWKHTGGGKGGSPSASPPVSARSSQWITPSQRFYGTVKYYLKEKQYGFLQSESLVPVLGKPDVFIHGSHAQHIADQLQSGNPCSFSLSNDASGKPMAVEVQMEDPGSEASWSHYGGDGGALSPSALQPSESLDAYLGQRFQGIVKFYSPEKRYGFLNCEVLPLPKGDVFVHASHLVDPTEFKQGAVYTFTLALDEKRKPMATDLMLEAVATPTGLDTTSYERYRGYVKYFNQDKGFGFLVCDDLAASFGKPDIFIHQSNVPNKDLMQEGRFFAFSLTMDHAGKPMAVDLEPDMSQIMSEPPTKRLRTSGNAPQRNF